MAQSIDEEHCAKDASTLYYPNLRSCLSCTLVYESALVGCHLTIGTNGTYANALFTKMNELNAAEGQLMSIFLIGNLVQFTTNQTAGTKNMRLPKKLLTTLQTYFGNTRIVAFDSCKAFGDSNAVKLEQFGTAAPFVDAVASSGYTTTPLNPVPADLFKLRRLEEHSTTFKPATAVAFALNTGATMTEVHPDQFNVLT